MALRSPKIGPILLYFFLFTASAEQIPIPIQNALIHKSIPNENVGLVVIPVDNSKTIIQLNANQAFSPASTIKLVTTSAALDLLGPSFTWQTRVYTTGKLKNGVLNGDLIFQGSGDPKLVVENFWLFLRKIYNSGIRQINGDIILDRTAFDTPPYDASQFDDDPIKPYNVGPDALLLNYKTLSVHFLPDTTQKAVYVFSETPFLKFKTRVHLKNTDCPKEWQEQLHLTQSPSKFMLKGDYALNCGEKIWQIHPYQITSTQFFENVFHPLWQSMGGKFKGTIKEGKLPKEANLFSQWNSPPLTEVIRDINKYSNNVMSRQLFLSLTRPDGDSPATLSRSNEKIVQWLKSKEINAPELIIENGSGLSRQERISPATLAHILRHAYDSPLMPEFISSLPIVAYDGTMRRRLNVSSIAGRAHIKTGYLEGVRSIAGYVLAESGKHYIVVCFINHPKTKEAREIQDILLQWIMDNG
jgi:D-alanyl-D-alanine carboxypeptidase/D-alanyl-D-alanine-endopeptidase (penicillin-binding protein 4)